MNKYFFYPVEIYYLEVRNKFSNNRYKLIDGIKLEKNSERLFALIENNNVSNLSQPYNLKNLLDNKDFRIILNNEFFKGQQNSTLFLNMTMI